MDDLDADTVVLIVASIALNVAIWSLLEGDELPGASPPHWQTWESRGE